ncbi:hypothetical protein [Gloeobacter kilaueensis]|uniref:Uncharacterized protein n=1 Tax=Gloeobacter kilaueensis (strain ATCC BAA-2537 / CCAP 1431/1 / ULC 316 / JS1) TaxID=1183438 RepID=U5QN89_GLOK1|nr:hypothetical protein [Gloeobacter kilaueensis]AGY59150.1 hypothetical protein GKIL_2904 [Gloeobacter kilaueensis JS1]
MTRAFSLTVPALQTFKAVPAPRRFFPSLEVWLHLLIVGVTVAAIAVACLQTAAARPARRDTATVYTLPEVTVIAPRLVSRQR